MSSTIINIAAERLRKSNVDHKDNKKMWYQASSLANLLAFYSNYNGAVPEVYKASFFQKVTGMSRNTFYARLKDAEELGFISWQRSDGNSPARIKVTAPWISYYVQHTPELSIEQPVEEAKKEPDPPVPKIGTGPVPKIGTGACTKNWDTKRLLELQEKTIVQAGPLESGIPPITESPAGKPVEGGLQEEDTTGNKNTEDKTSSSPDNDDQGSGQGFESEIENEQENEGESSDAQDQTGDESTQSEAADDSEPEESEESGSAVEHSAGEDTSRIETDEAFRASEKDLLEGDEDNPQPIAVSDLTRNDVKNAIISYEEIFKGRDLNLSIYGAGVVDNDKLLCDYDEFMNDNDRVVKLMVKEFETRKAAFRYSRATTSKTGMLDTVKMHSYKYNEDIFARSTKLADSKNHGMFMLVDYSGSMSGTLAQIQRQVISLVSFCRKVNIPFRVLGFTSGTSDKEFSTNLDLASVKIFELFSNEMTKSEFEKAVFQVYAQGWELQNRYGYPAFMSRDEHLGGTPLNETLIVLHKVVPEFKAKYNLDKVNLTVLTDGDANSMYLNRNEGESVTTNRNQASVNINGKRIVIGARFGTSTLIDEFRKQGITTLGYYVPGGNYDFRNAMYKCGIRSEEDVRVRRREFTKQKFTSFDNVLGFDRYFVLRSGRDIDAKTEEFDVKDGAKKGELTRQFKKFTGSKKGNRVLATRFAEMVA